MAFWTFFLRKLKTNQISDLRKGSTVFESRSATDVLDGHWRLEAGPEFKNGWPVGRLLDGRVAAWPPQVFDNKCWTSSCTWKVISVRSWRQHIRHCHFQMGMPHKGPKRHATWNIKEFWTVFIMRKMAFARTFSPAKIPIVHWDVFTQCIHPELVQDGPSWTANFKLLFKSEGIKPFSIRVKMSEACFRHTK